MAKTGPRVLLTGATGFLGSHLARFLVGKGCDVVALVRPGADLKRVADLVAGIHLVEGDLLAPATLREAVARLAPELCFHLAWYATPGRYLTARENVDCLAGTLALFARLEDAGCRRVVFAGTCIEYDTDVGFFDEESPVRPRSVYAACKQAVSLVAERLVQDRGWACASARLFHPYGPWEDERRLIPYVIRSLLADQPCGLTSGEQIRDFVHAEDVAAGLWAIAERGLSGPVNVGSSVPTRVAAVARDIGRLLGRPELVHLGARQSPPGEPSCLCSKPGRLRREAGWAPRYDLDGGLMATIEWWKRRLA